MRKIILTLFSLAMLFGLSLTAFAVSEPEILREPQNLTWPENSVAAHSVISTVPERKPSMLAILLPSGLAW